jgi:hypothetical protein
MQTDAVIDALVADPQLKAFVRDRRIEALHAKMWRRRELLDAVAQAFEPGRPPHDPLAARRAI